MEKTSGGAVRFAGYASVFDHADRSGDIVRKGAFAQAVAAGPKGVPLLWQHDPKRPIGRIERIEEDARGLRVIGRLSGASGPGRDAAALLKDGAINGLSFGYRARSVVSADNHAIDIDASGDGWVRMSSGPTATIRVRYQAGMAANWNGVPEPLRQGIVRLVAHMHLHRDGDQSPPAAVAALWRPWRRMRLK